MVEEQNRFITDASHELRTPLTTLKTEIEVNLRNKKLSVEEAKAILKSNLEEVNNLQVLSDDLIKLTRYQPEKNVLTLVEVTSKQLFDEAVKKIVNQSEAKKIKITELFFHPESLAFAFERNGFCFVYIFFSSPLC